MMAQATEGDRHGKALPLALFPGRGNFQGPEGQLMLRPHLIPVCSRLHGPALQWGQ